MLFYLTAEKMYLLMSSMEQAATLKRSMIQKSIKITIMQIKKINIEKYPETFSLKLFIFFCIYSSVKRSNFLIGSSFS